MKNPGSAIRSAYKTALASLTYNGDAVTVYDNMPIETTPDNYVYINSIDYDQEGNNQLFIHTVAIALDVVTKQYKKQDLDLTDGIAEAMQNIILTYPYSTLTNTNYQILAPNIESARYLIEQDGAYFIVRKIVRFSQTLIQK